MDDHPTYYDDCLKTKDICIHPHVVYRSPFLITTEPKITPQIFSVSTELTLNFEYYQNKIDLIKVQIVDINKLNKNKNNKKWKPQNAIKNILIKH